MVGRLNPNNIVPTAPRGTSTNQAASTAFVTGSGGAGPRTQLIAATNFYINPQTGNDSNTGLTSGSPWQTMVPTVNQYDFGGQTVTLNLTAGATGQIKVLPWVGGGALVINLGGFTLTYAGVSGIDGTILINSGPLPGPLTIQNGTISGSNTSALYSNGISVLSASIVFIGTGITFGNNHFSCVYTLGGAFVHTEQNISLASGASFLSLFFANGGTISSAVPSITISLLGNITCSSANNQGLVTATTAGFVYVGEVVWALNGHTVTGKAAYAETAGTVHTGGRGVGSIPGSIAGSFNSPGIIL